MSPIEAPAPHFRSIGINPFFREQSEKGKIQWPQLVRYNRDNFEWLICEVRHNLNLLRYKPGYREGVWLVSINHQGWRTRVVDLKDGMEIRGSYTARAAGEGPRKQSGVVVQSEKDFGYAQHVEVVLYENHVLAEKDEPRTDKEIDIIAVLCHPCPGGAPMSPGTLMSNHFGVSGGTNTNMTPEQFEQALKESFLWWRNRAMAEVEEKCTWTLGAVGWASGCGELFYYTNLSGMHHCPFCGKKIHRV